MDFMMWKSAPSNRNGYVCVWLSAIRRLRWTNHKDVEVENHITSFCIVLTRLHSKRERIFRRVKKKLQSTSTEKATSVYTSYNDNWSINDTFIYETFFFSCVSFFVSLRLEFLVYTIINTSFPVMGFKKLNHEIVTTFVHPLEGNSDEMIWMPNN